MNITIVQAATQTEGLSIENNSIKRECLEESLKQTTNTDPVSGRALQKEERDYDEKVSRTTIVVQLEL